MHNALILIVTVLIRITAPPAFVSSAKPCYHLRALRLYNTTGANYYPSGFAWLSFLALKLLGMKNECLVCYHLLRQYWCGDVSLYLRA